jgi:hypothetical protein
MKAINKDGLTLGFDLQKVVAIPYALINPVNKFMWGSMPLISSKITNSITSRSLTVTDLQHKETHFDKTNQTNQTHLRFQQIMWGSMPLMTVSTTVITVLHSAEVVHIPHE